MNRIEVPTKYGPLKKAALATALVILSLAPAHASPILLFSEVGIGTPVRGTATGSSTTIRATDVLVSISGIAAGIATPVNAYFTFNTASTDPAVLGANGNYRQNYAGTFEIFSGMNLTGTNYLSGSFNDLFEGLNASATIIASTPPATAVTFTSDVIPASQLGVDRAVSLAFTSVTPGITSAPNGTIPSFSSSVSGNFSADDMTVSVPEPASLALLGIGTIATGLLFRRRHPP